MSEDGLGDAIVSAGRWLAERGLAPGSSGNLSVRFHDGWFMTPTATALGRLALDRLARLDASGILVDGAKPTKESPLHMAVYQARPSARAIVHLHSTYAVALASLADLDPETPLPPTTPYQVMRVFPIGLVPYARPGSLELAEAVRFHAGRSHALLLANHGTLVAAPSLEAAVFAAEEFEEAAKLHFILDRRPTRRLNQHQIDEIGRALRS